MEIWQIVLLGFCISIDIILSSTFLTGTLHKDPCEIGVLPWEIKETHKKLNWFGAIFLSILGFIFITIYWVVKFMIWLCTIKKEK